MPELGALLGLLSDFLLPPLCALPLLALLPLAIQPAVSRALPPNEVHAGDLPLELPPQSETLEH